MTRRNQLISGAAIVLALVVLIVVVQRTRSSSAGAAPDSMAGMAGMQGMSPDGAVRLTASQLTTFGVTFGTVEQRTLSTEVPLRESRQQTLTFE